MNQDFFNKMMNLAKKLNNFELALMLKCEICGPILRGDNKSKYPKCKKHTLI